MYFVLGEILAIPNHAKEQCKCKKNQTTLESTKSSSSLRGGRTGQPGNRGGRGSGHNPYRGQSGRGGQGGRRNLDSPSSLVEKFFFFFKLFISFYIIKYNMRHTINTICRLLVGPLCKAGVARIEIWAVTISPAKLTN